MVSSDSFYFGLCSTVIERSTEEVCAHSPNKPGTVATRRFVTNIVGPPNTLGQTELKCGASIGARQFNLCGQGFLNEWFCESRVMGMSSVG